MANLSNFGDLKTRLGQLLGMDQPAQLTLLGEFINEAGQEVYHAHAWPRRKMYAVLKMEAAIEVAAGTGGLAGTAGSATLTTIDARDFSGYGEWKLARGSLPASEWYWINDNGSGAGSILTNHTARETFSGEAYVLYKDEYQLPADVHSLLANEIHLLGPDNTVLGQMNEARVAEMWPDPTGLGVPRRFTLASIDPATAAQDENVTIGTSDQLRIRVGPLAPDEAYSFRYGYLRRWEPLTDDAHVPVLDYQLRHLIIEGALALAYAWLDEYRGSNLAERQESRFRRRLKQAIKENRPLRPRVTVVRPFDKPSHIRGLRYTLPPED